MMNQTKMVALLQRPLSPYEVTNFQTYLKIARERLEDLTCLYLEDATEDRIYEVREGYTTVFTDPFTAINSVEINGETFTDYTPMQWNRRNASWYNSIVLETCEDQVTINADWGLCSPELQLLTARLFDLLSKERSGNGNVKSKKVEDFSITFNENTAYDQFLLDNQALINKFSICNIGDIQHGSVRRFDIDRFDWQSYRSRPY
jgi:hypothetical protein